jgi:hypothetical protein
MDQAKSWDHTSELHDHDAATHTPMLTPEEARQGVISGRVRLVLLVSLTLVVVAFALVYVVNL